VTVSDGDPAEEALARAYRFVGRRERTTLELRRHLEASGVTSALIDVTVAELREQGYLDDARFARLFAQDKRTLEQWGSERIARALRERGLDRDLVDDAVGAHDHDDELAQAVAVLQRRCPTPPRDRRERDRALGILMRKGYESELALDALNIYKRGASDPGVD
jgi:regulatory protein